MHRQKLTVIGVLLAGCGGSEEATPVDLNVVVDGGGIGKTTNDLGYVVTFSAFQAAVTDVQFTIEGEMHAGWLESVGDWLVTPAYAHPGHYAGGTVTGELLGDFIVDWMASNGSLLGVASMLPGTYRGGNFTFRHARADDGLADDDPLLGHTVFVAGTATRDDQTIEFTAVLDIDEGTDIVGLPMDLEVDDATQVELGLAVFPIDPFEKDTIVDGLDWASLDDDGDGIVAIAPGQDAHNLLRRAVQVHDYYGISIIQGE